MWQSVAALAKGAVSMELGQHGLSHTQAATMGLHDYVTALEYTLDTQYEEVEVRFLHGNCVCA